MTNWVSGRTAIPRDPYPSPLPGGSNAAACRTGVNRYTAPLFDWKRNATMAIDLKPGQTVRVTVSKKITRESARKTLERLFMKDREIAGPIEKRSRNFKELPKRRGGAIWTKRPNKVHPTIARGAAANVKVTPQAAKDLRSVEDFITVG